MHKTFCKGILFLALVWVNLLNAGTIVCQTLPQIHFKLNAGYRQDMYDWRKQERLQVFPFFPGVKIQNHLKFEHVKVALLGGEFLIGIPDCYFIRVYGDVGYIGGGVLRDRFKVNNQDHYRVNNKIDKGFVGDISISIGNPVHLMSNRLVATPMLGYSYHAQNITVKNQERLFDVINPIDAILAGIHRGGRKNNNFHFSEWAPWIGLDIFFHSCDGWSFYGYFEWQFLGRARRERNTHVGLSYLDRFSITRRVNAYQAKIGSKCFAWHPFFMDLYIDYRYWKSRADHDHFTWSSMGIGVNFGYVF